MDGVAIIEFNAHRAPTISVERTLQSRHNPSTLACSTSQSPYIGQPGQIDFTAVDRFALFALEIRLTSGLMTESCQIISVSIHSIFTQIGTKEEQVERYSSERHSTD